MITQILLIPIAAGSIMLHELAHLLLAHFFFGKNLRSLSNSHLPSCQSHRKFIANIKPSLTGLSATVRGLEKLSLAQRYAIYLAGPATNVLIAIGALVVAWLTYCPYGILCGVGQTCDINLEYEMCISSGSNLEYETCISSGIVTSGSVLHHIMLINIVLTAFNLLPIFPLDGGRLAQLFFGNRLGILRANRALLMLAKPVSAAIMALGLVQAILYPWNITLVCAGFYIRKKNKALPPILYLEWLQAMKAKQARAVSYPIKKITLPKDATVKQAVAYLGWDYVYEIKIGSGKYITEAELLKYINIV